MKLFAVEYDGPSRPMIRTPTGRLLSINEFQDGRWSSYEREDADCKTIVGVLNWLLESASGSERIETELEYLERL